MRNTVKFCIVAAIAFLLLTTSNAFAQYGPGKIIRSAPVNSVSNGARDILDPNENDWVSATTSGFTNGDDVSTSEVMYKPLRPYSLEPNSDLRRGPNNKFTDFVPGVDNASYYMYYNAGNNALLFRMRLGSVVPGAKGYSILFDTDGKFGATGPNADPNYIAATTGTGGNPGFEREVVLATGGGQDGVLIYNVDGTDNPTSPTIQSGWTNFSQISIAATNDNADPDFYLDFFVANATTVLGITSLSDLRVIPTTVMAPKAAIGGPKSDIYGLSDNNYKDPMAQYEAFINAQPPVTLTTLSAGNTNALNAARCTAPPTLNGNITPGASVAVSGTWAPAGLTGDATQAIIKIFVSGNPTAIGQVTTAVYSGTPVNWTVSGLNITTGQTVTAKAVATGESECLSSNGVVASSCNSSTTSSVSSITIICATNRGFDGAAPAGAVVRIYTVTFTGFTLFADEATTTNRVTRPTATRWVYEGPNANSADPCGGGAADVPSASYAITIQEPGKCESPYLFVCNGLNATTTTPVISQSVLYAGNTTVSGTAVTGSTVRVSVNGRLQATVTATGGGYSATLPALALNDVVEVYAQSSGQCVSAVAARTVTCFTPTPTVNADANNNLQGGQAITGTSGSPAGTVVRIYNSANTLVASTTVQSNGTWSTANVGTTNSNGFTGVAVTGTAYYANAQAGSCGVSSNTATFSTPASTNGSYCGTIANTNIVNTEASLTVNFGVSVPAGTVINIYQDGTVISTLTLPAAATTTAIDVTGRLYTGGVLSIGIRQGSNAEVICGSTRTVTCSAPPTPTLAYRSCTNCTGQNNVNNGGTITYDIGNLTGETFYSLKSTTGTTALALGLWTPATAPFPTSITTTELKSGGAQNAVLVATSISTSGTCSAQSAQSAFTVVLPVELLEFKGRRTGNSNFLQWRTAMEVNVRHFELERSVDGRSFVTIAAVAPGAYNYSFTDNVPLNGVVYYRLRTVDDDGSFSLSKAIALSSAGQAIVLSAVYPNPFQSSVTVNFQTDRSTPVTLLLTDALGQVVRRIFVTSSAGLNKKTFTGLASLPHGFYVIKLITAYTTLEQKLIKQAQ